MYRKSCVLLIGSLLIGLMMRESSFGDVPAFEVDVREVEGGIAFEFFREEGWLWFKRRVPNEIFELSVHMKGGVPQLWVIESPVLRRVTVTYGSVPAGFVQKIPHTGKPPMLEAGTTYYVSARGGGIGARAFTVGKSR